MLVIYSVILSFVEDVALLTPRIAHHDRGCSWPIRRRPRAYSLTGVRPPPTKARNRRRNCELSKCWDWGAGSPRTAKVHVRAPARHMDLCAH